MIKVVCAIILKNNNILITKRSEAMANPNTWEFPGGKVHANEDFFEAIRRECLEELNLKVAPYKIGKSITHIYPYISIKLTPVFCHSKNWDIQLTEHSEYRFVSPYNLASFDLSEADVKLIEANRAHFT